MQLKDTRTYEKWGWGKCKTRAICKKCSAPCCRVTTVILDREFAEHRLKEFKGKYNYNEYYLSTATGTPTKVPCLNKKKDGSCVFFDSANETCKIYERRPAACRVFFCGRGTKNARAWRTIIDEDRRKQRTLKEKT